MRIAPETLLEQIVERLLGARGTGGLGRGFRLAFHRRAGLEDGARVARVLRRDASGNRLLTLECRTGVEVGALRAAVQVALAAGALAGRAPRRRHGELVAAPRALHDLAEPGHAEGFRRERRLTARRVFHLLLRLAFAAGLAGLVLVAALAVLAFGHAVGRGGLYVSGARPAR